MIISAVNYLRIIDFFSFERNEDANFLLNFLESKRITNTSSLKIYAIIFSIERATTAMRRSKMGKSARYGKIISIFPFLHLKIEFPPPSSLLSDTRDACKDERGIVEIGEQAEGNAQSYLE